MTTDDELRSLIDRARKHGADVQVVLAINAKRLISRCRIGSGIPGVGHNWMPPIIAAELLREFIAEREAGL